MNTPLPEHAYPIAWQRVPWVEFAYALKGEAGKLPRDVDESYFTQQNLVGITIRVLYRWTNLHLGHDPGNFPSRQALLEKWDNLNNVEAMQGADMNQINGFLHWLVEKDRHDHGAVVDVINSGVLPALLLRLEELRYQPSPFSIL